MRLAKTNDIWRGLYKEQKRPLEQISITYKEAVDGPNLILKVDAPISLLCGENGVGKSRALRALYAAFGGKLSPIDFRPSIGPKPSHIMGVAATFRRVGEDNSLGQPITLNSIDLISAELLDSAGDSRLFSFDPTLQVPYLLHLLRHDSSLPDLWEGVSPKKLSADELEEISALVGRTYSSVDFYEIADYQNHEVVPYFRVSSNSETYGAEDMGLGELSLLFFYWTLSRVTAGSVLLLEEPETFVAPKAQRNLIDLLAATTTEKNIFAIIASHSGIIAERVPGTHIDYVSRFGKTVSFMRNPARNIMAERLALVPPRSAVALLEDKASLLLTRAILEAGNSRYMSHCTLLIAGSESEITNVLGTVKTTEIKGNVVIVGIYDGDQRKSLPKYLPWPVLCLPGDDPPENLARHWLDAHHDQLPRLLNRDLKLVQVALASVDGQNHHDWLEGLSNYLQMSLDELFRRVAQGLSEFEPGKIKNFIAEFEAKLAGKI